MEGKQYLKCGVSVELLRRTVMRRMGKGPEPWVFNEIVSGWEWELVSP